MAAAHDAERAVVRIRIVDRDEAPRELRRLGRQIARVRVQRHAAGPRRLREIERVHGERLSRPQPAHQPDETRIEHELSRPRIEQMQAQQTLGLQHLVGRQFVERVLAQQLVSVDAVLGALRRRRLADVEDMFGEIP